MPAPKKPRKKTRYWEDENSGWNYEVVHPDGHRASGAYFESKADAQAAAKQVQFGS